jgi:hypothetical protein
MPGTGRPRCLDCRDFCVWQNCDCGCHDLEDDAPDDDAGWDHYTAMRWAAQDVTP